MRTSWILVTAALAVAGCVERQDPPGAAASASANATIRAEGASASSSSHPERTAKGETLAKDVLGTERDNLPFEPDGTKLASIAWRTWVYTDTGPQRTRYGYLRAGSVVDARGPAIANDGCAGGWYRINPRGFVCIGKGATLDLKDPVVVANAVRPVRGQGLPYLYALASEVAPLRYFRLVSKEEMEKVEGEGVVSRVVGWKERLKAKGGLDFLGVGDVPEFLSTKEKVPKAYGVPQHLHFAVHAGRAAPDSGFAIMSVFEHEGRLFGLTTELDIIALDRTRVVRPSTFHGAELGEGETLPVAFLDSHYSQRFKQNDAGQLSVSENLSHRQALKLTGKKRLGFYELRDGDFVPQEGLRIVEPRESYPSFAVGTRKWIDISIREQTLVAYVGKKPVYATLVSTGRGGMGDPEKVHATARGTFMIHSKHVSATMDGSEDKSDSYNLLDVPFVQYFHKGYALHGTYWHDEFGKVRSHGCVNLSPIDAAWLFEWTDPIVPVGWHSVLNKDRGTVVFIHG
ncbi:MAG: L,D-transpeptidase [Polyangiaceae bacterium]